MSELDDLLTESLAARDHSIQQAPVDIKALLEAASMACGRDAKSLVKEIKRCRRFPGRLTATEFLNHRLYELEATEQAEFISEWLHWPIHDFCQDLHWSPRTVDKWLCTDELIRADIPTIPIVAMVDRSSAIYGGTPKVTTTGELVELLDATDLPLFAKPNRLLGSFGAFRVEEFDGRSITIAGGERLPVDEVIFPFMSDAAYVLQAVVSNHEDIASFADSLATVRTVNFVRGDSVRLAAVVLKIPVGDNIADNAWRSGNLVADVDPETGVVRRVVEGAGPMMIEHVEHPESGQPLVGLQLPDWDEVLALNARTASHFSMINYQSLDIAFTNAGPIVVEVNSGGSFALPQQASGRGLLTEENRRFFESCGVSFRKLPKTPS